MINKVDDNTSIVVKSEDPRISPQQWSTVFSKLNTSSNSIYKEFWSQLENKVTAAQVFEFGDIEDSKIIKDAPRAAELISNKYLDLPFNSVIYWYTLNTEVHSPNRMATIIVKGIIENSQFYFIADFRKLSYDELQVYQKTINNNKCAYILAGAGYLNPDMGNNAWSGDIISVPDGLTKYHSLLECKNITASSLGDGMSYLSLLVATKGIPRNTETPSAKLQAKRKSNNKYPLSSVTYIDTHYYSRAVNNTDSKLTHASPVPHLRRGHIRNYQDGQKVWIKDTIVNCVSAEEISSRNMYKVK